VSDLIGWTHNVGLVSNLQYSLSSGTEDTFFINMSFGQVCLLFVL